MSKEENKMENQEPVIITFNGTEYRAADMNEEQMALAAKLNIAGKKLSRLQEYYDDYVITDEYKNLRISRGNVVDHQLLAELCADLDVCEGHVREGEVDQYVGIGQRFME